MIKFLKSAWRDYSERRLSVGSVLIGLYFLALLLIGLFKIVESLGYLQY